VWCNFSGCYRRPAGRQETPDIDNTTQELLLGVPADGTIALRASGQIGELGRRGGAQQKLARLPLAPAA
jgi:hypothetical protein